VYKVSKDVNEENHVDRQSHFARLISHDAKDGNEIDGTLTIEYSK